MVAHSKVRVFVDIIIILTKWLYNISCFKVKCLLCLKERTYSNKIEMVNEAQVNLVFRDSQPLSIVEDGGFREILHVLDPMLSQLERYVINKVVHHYLKS